jgi:hypothetical protein
MSHFLFFLFLSLFLLYVIKMIPVPEIVLKFGIDRQCLKPPPSKGDD